jgi:hypothetical protein
VAVLALLVGLLRLLFVLLVVRLVGRFVTAAMRGYRGQVGAPAAGPRLASRELVRDRVCNTFLARDRALAATVAGEVEHFCSAACRDLALSGARPKAMHHG